MTKGRQQICWRPFVVGFSLGQLSLEPERDESDRDELDREDDAPYDVDSLPDPLDALIPEELLDPLP